MKEYDELLCQVHHPSQYIGCEVGSVIKDPREVSCRLVLAYPDLYKLGMSYLGLHILYHAVNSQEDLWAERVFAPEPDMERILAESDLPLSSLESRTPLSDFDLVGFTLQHELTYLDVLAMLKMGNIPLRSSQRQDEHPIIIAGGPCASNPEPLAPAFDAVYLGDGEEGLIEVCRLVGKMKREKQSRQKIISQLADISGLYIPSLYQAEYDAEGKFTQIAPKKNAPAVVHRRVVDDINRIEACDKPIVPCSQTVHERLAIEIQRGCSRGCRFCQAGMINRPVRQRRSSNIIKTIEQGLKNSGLDQVSFLSLSSGDHPCILEMLAAFFKQHSQKRISASLPSLRAETLTPELAALVKTVRKSGFTIAPEAGTARLRKVINKQLSEEDIVQGALGAFNAGWRLIKLYFMVGLPTETEEDHQGIVKLVTKVYQTLRAAKHRPQINVGISTFVPKAQTPFQWQAMIEPERAFEIHQFIRQQLKRLKGVKIGWSQTSLSWAEGILSRGDRRQFEALEQLSESGQRLAGWSEYFNEDIFKAAFDDLRHPHGTNTFLQARSLDKPLPWSHLDMGPSLDFLKNQRELSLAEQETPDCTIAECFDCGACNQDNIIPNLETKSSTLPADSSPPKTDEITDQPKWVRIKLSKTDKAAYMSHIEFMVSITRTLRRADWPLVYTQGFHPKPKMSFGPACQVGCQSMAEMLDICVSETFDAKKHIAAFKNTLPPGIVLLESTVLEERKSIMKQAKAVRYRLRSREEISGQDVLAKIKALMDQKTWLVERHVKGKQRQMELRPSIQNIELNNSTQDPEVVCELSLKTNCTARPSEVAYKIFGHQNVSFLREAIIFDETTNPESNP
jgi:radical SAM family uncharacterized protein/radical SAM-linked protein